MKRMELTKKRKTIKKKRQEKERQTDRQTMHSVTKQDGYIIHKEHTRICVRKGDFVYPFYFKYKNLDY